MFRKLNIVILIVIYCFTTSQAVNHWATTKDGAIKPQLDSPYYLRRPHDLVAFLRQSEYLQLIVLLNAKLLTIKTELAKQMELANTYTIDFMYQTECIINYFIKDVDMYSTIKNKKYLNKINIKKLNKNIDESAVGEYSLPICEDVDFSMTCFEHLDSMLNRKKLDMAPETSLLAKELGIASPSFVDFLVIGLKNEPLSWRYHTLSSYYWRLRGMAYRSMACARRALLLAPRKYKDIPLLSIGTILQRTNNSQDAVTVLYAATDHAPHIPENQLALANSLFLIADFNKSMEYYKNARALDESYAEKEKFMEKSMSCFKYIKMILKQLETQLIEMRVEVKNYTEGKQYLDEYLEKLLREQVPIGARLLDPSFDMHAHHLLNRGQYCSTRITPHSKEPVLFCDFYSDLQMQLENKDWTINTIQNYIDTATEFITNHFNSSLGSYKHKNIESFSGDLELK